MDKPAQYTVEWRMKYGPATYGPFFTEPGAVLQNTGRTLVWDQRDRLLKNGNLEILHKHYEIVAIGDEPAAHAANTDVPEPNNQGEPRR